VATILVVTSAPPLVEGGHLVIARALERALVEAGHRAAVLTTPSNRFGRQASAYLANWLTDVGRTGDGAPVDRVISLRYPSYAVRHRSHVCWLNHTMREYYDLWDDFSARLSPQGRIKERARRSIVHAADRYLLRHNVTRVVAQSDTVRRRLRTWRLADAEVLHPPPPPRAYRCDGYGDYLFVVSRLSPLKRVDLVLRALADPAARHVRCVVGGEGEARADLERLAGELGLGGRVRFAGRLSEDELLAHYAGCRAVAFVPRDEDYGFVTTEAFASGKPVVTTTDSGGPSEFVRDGENGYVTAPAPAPLAAAIAAVMGEAAAAERMGQQGRQDTAGLTWPETVRRLTADAPGR
jgi:glycosyltransferase involved in cell wall biosynthesis